MKEELEAQVWVSFTSSGVDTSPISLIVCAVDNILSNQYQEQEVAIRNQTNNVVPLNSQYHKKGVEHV